MTAKSLEPVTISLPRPLAWQKPLLDFDGSIVIFAGRRTGKTQLGVYKILKSATQNVGLYWWVGLSWRSASMKRAWRLLKFYARRIWAALGVSEKRVRFIRESDGEILLPNGSMIWMRTAEREDSLAGEAVRGVVVDEFSLMKEVVWTEYIEATLLDYEGWALFIGVPKGENWAAQLWRIAHNRKGWRAGKFTTYDNPKMSLERIEQIRLNVSKNLFDQEYMAEILPDGGIVFRKVAQASVLQPQDGPKDGQIIVGGLDWGKDNDFTVISLFDAKTRQQVYVDRFNEIGWTLQRAWLGAIIEKWKPKIILGEVNSIGGPNVEALQEAGYPVSPFTTTNESKAEIVENMSLSLEQEQIKLIDNAQQRLEFGAFTLTRLPSGRYRYEAPSGLHDDMVMATCLGNYACDRANTSPIGFA